MIGVQSIALTAGG